MSASIDQLPDAGDEVLCVVRSQEMPDMAWIEFASGKRIEVRLWIEKEQEEADAT
jgi:hypothetical protein